MVSGRLFFDAQLHVIDPRFPIVPNLHYTPGLFTVPEYLHQVRQLLNVAGFSPAGGAVVSASFQATDQTYLTCALAELGPGFVGVTQLPSDVPDKELLRLEEAGVRALRLNLVRRVHTGELDGQLALAERARSLLGWHLELYVRSVDLPALREKLPPAEGLVVEHLGLTTAGLPALLSLVRDGARVKASGFSRGDLVVQSALQAIHRINPSALMAATDLPGTRAPRPITAADLVLLTHLFKGEDLTRVTYRNAVQLYRVSSPCSDAERA